MMKILQVVCVLTALINIELRPVDATKWYVKIITGPRKDKKINAPQKGKIIIDRSQRAHRATVRHENSSKSTKRGKNSKKLNTVLNGFPAAEEGRQNVLFPQHDNIQKREKEGISINYIHEMINCYFNTGTMKVIFPTKILTILQRKEKKLTHGFF